MVLRPSRAEDEPFLGALYASTRADEVAATGWPQDQIDAFLASQFAFQSAHYAAHYGDAAFSVVEQDGEPVGRLIVATWPEEVRIVDVALVPERRGRGTGTALLRGVLASAGARRVTIHVEQFNPALRLYDRLGFRPVQADGVYLLMEWTPPALPDAAAGEGP
ncbi:MAG TPA: GNAT family N-acetyltransferase [Rubricoccaceae bacterium]